MISGSAAGAGSAGSPGSASDGAAAAQAAGRVDADRFEELEVAAVDLEQWLAGGGPGRGRRELLGLVRFPFAVDQQVERIALFANLAQRAADLRGLRDGFGERATQVAKHVMQLVVQLHDLR